MIFPNFSQPNQHQPTPHDANRDSTKFTNPGQLWTNQWNSDKLGRYSLIARLIQL